MSYYEIIDGEVELTPTGQYVMDYLGLEIEDLKRMSAEDLKSHVKKFSDVLNDGRLDKETKPHRVFSSVDKYEGYGSITKKQGEVVNYGDGGSFSRYFSLDAWWSGKLKQLPKEVQKTFPFPIVPKASKSEKNKGLNGEANSIPYSEYRRNFDTTKSYVSEYPDGKPRPMNKAINNHPTVKPIKLGSYLITLGSREGDVVLDPFCGSGSFCISAYGSGRHFIGIEKEEKAHEIAEARVKDILMNMRL